MRKQRFFMLVFSAMFYVVMSGIAAAQALSAEQDVPKVQNVPAEQVTSADERLLEYANGEGVTMIGDSIMSGNREIILSQLPNAYIDAKGSRDVCGGFEAAQKLQTEGNLSDVVVVELGTNGPLLEHEPYASGTQNLLKLLGTERQIFWVTTYCSYSQWMRMNNNYIWELSKTRPNITVIDWYALASNHPEWFKDGVHPNMEGARQFAQLLRRSLEARYGRQSSH